MYPSEVRERILEDQAKIKEELERMEMLLSQDSPEAVEDLRSLCIALIPRLMDHIQLDDEILVPALEETDAWADLRLSRLEEHHAHQRADIHLIVERLARPDASPEAIQAVAHKVLRDLRKDFREERKLMLSPEVLRDDLVHVSFIG